ncbi:cupin [Burkholderia pseudomultivorans]|uniref:2,4'-dihydroxyacetophenone dioxygenase family protein n=1 Tax=Burkholderia pseudomultivorans TaxID=1207504 RepID=UPI00075EAFFC|nr:2,4'-dihydroxyacetophenone dioxygenase family protein [Burkholderia pseudomultivorans]AOI89595.1 cupin [Burkholderia pseudomultivorans]KVC24853.1 cupin [Burkholderia pseudomultivorans]KVC34708.1 cupin [Burkholderia pseudomultivorans]KVC52056.1 cupin [Burkholderia pseudomultivorans]
MFYENVATECIDDASMPWIPMSADLPDVKVKYFKLDPTRGEIIVLLKSPAHAQLPKHHHTGTVIVYTLSGRWKYVEHDWVAGPGSLVFETAASRHTPQALPGDEIVTLNIVQGELIYLDDEDRIISTQNWSSALQHYLSYCAGNGTTPKDITAFGA